MAYDNPDGLIAAAVIVQVLVLLAVGLRVATRVKHGGKLYTSDWLMCVATILATGQAIMQVYGVTAGVFGHLLTPQLGTDAVRNAELRFRYRQYQYSSLVIGLVAVGFVKISVSFFYLHIFSTRRFRRVIIPWIILMVIWTVGFLTIHLTLCGSHGPPSMPFAKDPKKIAAYCGDGIKMGYSLVISGVITDLITVLLPLPMVLSLKLTLHQKVSLVAIFLVGLLSVGACAARAYIYISAALSLLKQDYAIITTSICVWNLVEVQVGILAACAPTLRPMVHDLVKSQAFNSLLSSAQSVMSRKSSTTNLSNRSNNNSTYAGNTKRSLSDATVSLVAADTELTSVDKPGAIRVLREYSVQDEARP